MKYFSYKVDTNFGTAFYEEGSLFISVLHVVSIVQSDYMSLFSYKPVTPG